MARIRTIKPEFCTSADVARLSREARLFFILMLTEADDEGRLFNSPKKLAGCLYPNDRDVGPVKVRRWLEELQVVDMIHAYEVGDGSYLQVVNFSKHQRVSHPTASRLPPEPVGTAARIPPEEIGSVSRPEVGSGSGTRNTPLPPAELNGGNTSEAPATGGGKSKFNPTTVAACQRLAKAERDIEEAAGRPVRNPEGWMRSKLDKLLAQHGARADELVAADPKLTASRLAGVLTNPGYAEAYRQDLERAAGEVDG